MVGKKLNKEMWSYVGRFALVHLVAYTVVGLGFLIFQNGLPETQRVALDFFEPYRPINLMEVVIQFLRGSILALLLYPFYNKIVTNKRSSLILFGALWGLSLLGSVEPMPGSIEGFIYTETTLSEHFMALIAGAFQILIFVWLFLRWETWANLTRRYTKAGGENHE